VLYTLSGILFASGAVSLFARAKRYSWEVGGTVGSAVACFSLVLGGVLTPIGRVKLPTISYLDGLIIIWMIH
jgi:hypothetical protein